MDFLKCSLNYKSGTALFIKMDPLSLKIVKVCIGQFLSPNKKPFRKVGTRWLHRLAEARSCARGVPAVAVVVDAVIRGSPQGSFSMASQVLNPMPKGYPK